MRLVFAGTPEFACTALQCLHRAGFDIVLVLTQPDRPGGRGMQLQPSPVKQFAQAHGMPVMQPRSLRLDGAFATEASAARTALEAAGADVMVVAAYGLILPQWVLDLMRQTEPDGSRLGLGCINIHASLLPRWRGAAPIHRAVEAGDRETGVTIMQMDAGLDTGDMLLAGVTPIDGADTTASLQDRLAELGGRLIVQALQQAAIGRLGATAQPPEGASYARKVGKDEAVLDWSLSAQQLERKIRAFDPFPGASTGCAGTMLKLWRAVVDDAPDAPAAPCGSVLVADARGVAVQCGAGVLRLTELQRAGGRRLSTRDFLTGFAIKPGTLLAAPLAG